jgi:hypothetical protein
MARYRFNWENLPASLLRAIADGVGLEGPPAAALRDAYGARPRANFVADSWPILLSAWLPRAKEARQAIVDELQSRKLGVATGKLKTAADQIAYLQTCRNSTTLRETVLTQVILAGEADLAPIPKSRPAPPNSPSPRVDVADQPQRGMSSLTDFVDQSLRSFLGVSEVSRDDDGDVPVRAGSSMCYLRVREFDDQPSLVILICPLVSKIERHPDILESINEINLQLTLGRVFFVEDRIMLEAELLADTLSPQELSWALDYIMSAADYFDSKLVARFGGSTMFDEQGAPGVEV